MPRDYKKDAELLDFVSGYTQKHGYPPTVHEVAVALGNSDSPVYWRIHGLQREGRVDWQAGKVRTLRVLKGAE